MDLKKLRNIQIKIRKYCVICSKTLGKPLIRMPDFPLTEFYVKKKPKENLGFANQEFHLCLKCGQGQLKNLIDPKILYGAEYITRTSASASAKWAIDVFLEFMEGVLKGRKIGTLLEIGCNDLYTLDKFKSRVKLLYGVDPILKGREKELNKGKIRVIGDFFENVDLEGLGIHPDIVLSSHTLEHTEEPKLVMDKLLKSGTKNTLYFFQFPGLETLVQDAHFDQIYHQHLNYFSLKSVLYMLESIGGELISYRVNPYHWGALMVAFRKATGRKANHDKFRKLVKAVTPEYVLGKYKLFLGNMELTRKRIDCYKGKTIYGYGAAQMLPVLEYYLKRIAKLTCIIDDDTEKEGMYYLNVPIEIKSPGKIKDIGSSAVLVTAVNSLQTIRSVVDRLIMLKAERIIIAGNVI